MYFVVVDCLCAVTQRLRVAVQAAGQGFYSIGVGIDLVKVFTKLFTPPK
jgi:hypothetical protein